VPIGLGDFDLSSDATYRVRVQMRRRAPDKRGAVALLTGMLLFVTFGILAFVADLGLAYVNKQRVQNGADAAAIAVAQGRF
jgi:Flp pilus assembly protein TadG